MSISTSIRRMTGRDPREDGRGASDLEVFYDLVFVVAFSIAGTQLAEYLAQGHYRAAIIGYAIATFASTWAWINFAWFASAFDTDDWIYRLLTLVQMVGVAIIAIGLPPVFASIDAGEHVNLTVVVIGYIVMRVAMIVHWLRAAVQAPEYRATCLVYAGMTAIAQVGWVVVMLVPLLLVPTLIGIGVCMVLELSGPAIAETLVKRTPWHPEHIVERYATLVVITLGEGVVGTVAVLQTLIAKTGWSVETGVLGLSAMGVTFAMWWLYFRLEVGRPLAQQPEKSFSFGYASMPIVIGCAASGAGLHLVAMWIDGQTSIPETALYAAVAVPIAVFCLGTLAMYFHLAGINVLAVPLVIAIVLPLIVGGVLAALGVTLLVPIIVVCLTPVLPVLVVEFAARSSVAKLRR
ncbi:low temperature requirement protein A [Gordonia phthalatica]|uniref:low temperature requirement protein A n=1 Tax=Gordonia phthalatica TaxID=1136941 RepID=UPI001D059C13|nr:low temperature requirement protein A [Gordonia phthalatica]